MTAIPDILDNSEGRKVGEVVWSLLLESPQPPSIDIATAYFNLAGFAMLEEGLRVAKRVRLLFGKEQEQDFVLGDALWHELQESLGSGKPPELIRALEDFLNRSEVEVRVLTDQFLHGKTFILEGVPVVGQLAIGGSSQLVGASHSRPCRRATSAPARAGTSSRRSLFPAASCFTTLPPRSGRPVFPRLAAR